jgi:thioredoxin 1
MIDINKIISENDKLIFNFHAVDWCQPCKMMEPILESIEKTTDIKVVKVNVEEENELAQLFGVSSIPTMVFYKDGEKVAEKIGVHQRGVIVDILA